MTTKHTLADDHYYSRDASHQSTTSEKLRVPADDVVHTGDHVHVTSIQLLGGVLALLLVLTFITVAVTWVDLGDLNIWIALIIAVVKALFVALYFMHLRWDSAFNSLVFGAALIFLGLFIATLLMDSAEYQQNMEPPGEAQISATAG